MPIYHSYVGKDRYFMMVNIFVKAPQHSNALI